MNEALSKVAEFHRLIDAPVAESSRLVPGVRAQAEALMQELYSLSERCLSNSTAADVFMLRLAMDLEELAEWVEAHLRKDLVAAADAWGDRLYVLLGDAVVAGLPGQAIFEEVHRSNLSKATRPAGSDGKAVKDAEFERPNLVPLLFVSRTTKPSEG